MSPAMCFFVTAWMAIGGFFSWAIYNTVEMWTSRKWRR